jgi:protein-L-isoaspartate(D-aspartate) O-methyltransferase
MFAGRKDYSELRRRMVERQLRRRGLDNETVLAAMGEVPREEFVPPAARVSAYADGPLAIGAGQTISQPYIVALMTSLVEPEPGKRILEIGSGSGYQAAVLAACGCEVYSVETLARLLESARENLERTGYLERVHLEHGNGYAGWPAEAPYDGALLTCAPPEIPQAIIEQVVEGGPIVGPRGRAPLQELVRLRRIGGEVREEYITGVLFVPMVDDGA